MESKKNNGRIDTADNLSTGEQIYHLFEEDMRPNNNYSQEAMKSIFSTNQVSNIFFSQFNLDLLQEAIRYQVYKKSCDKFVICRQSNTELRLIMRSIYLQWSKNQQYGILEQVKELNKVVLDFCIPRIIQEINIYSKYTKDINQLPVPLPNAEFVGTKGSKVLEQNDF